MPMSGATLGPDAAVGARVEPTAEDVDRPLGADLLTLTKPRIISLLLVTTIAAMYVAGSPSGWLVLTVFVGGYLMAGGAHAVNMYLDRDIDVYMSRTNLSCSHASRTCSRPRSR